MATNGDKNGKPQDPETDEIWQQIFGDQAKDDSKRQKAHHTLAPSKKARSRHPTKKRKIDHRSSSRSSSGSTTHSQTTNNIQSGVVNTNGHDLRNTSSSNSQYHQEGPTTIERLSQFLCTPKHRARLPPPPLKPKFLVYPHAKNRFIKYCATNLELNYHWEMHHDSLFPLPLDLMDPDYYNPLKNPDEDDEDAPINHKEDERIRQLLEDREYKRTAKEDRSLPEQEAFLLQTQYLTGGQEYELTESQRKTYDNNDYKNGRNKRKRRKYNDNDDGDDDDDDEEDGYYTNYKYNKRNNQHSVENVRKTFIDVGNITRHPRRNVEVAKMFDVFPHDKLLELEYTHVQFDNNPSMHTKKCNFMPKYKQDRMAMAEQASRTALLRCVNQKRLQLERIRNSKQEREEDEDDDLEEELNKYKDADPDWFSLYATDGKKKINDDEEIKKYEWTAEFVPVGIIDKKMHFLVIPKDGNTEDEEVYYATFDNRLSLRHRPTDSTTDSMMMAPGKQRLSEPDKKFFKQQPMTIKLNIPYSADSEDE